MVSPITYCFFIAHFIFVYGRNAQEIENFAHAKCLYSAPNSHLLSTTSSCQPYDQSPSITSHKKQPPHCGELDAPDPPGRYQLLEPPKIAQKKPDTRSGHHRV